MPSNKDLNVFLAVTGVGLACLALICAIGSMVVAVDRGWLDMQYSGWIAIILALLVVDILVRIVLFFMQKSVK